jgi:uncharacterized membrane protein
MKMKIGKTYAIALGIVVLSFLIAAYFYPSMPDKMVSHWNGRGEADGTLPKFWALFLVPLTSAGLLLLFAAVPKMDPLRGNIGKFRGHYDGFVFLMMSFLLYIFLLTIAWNLGLRFAFIAAMVPALALLFYYCGVLIENAKQNWFVGIRTPWTLSSERVWDKTHKRGGKLFKIAGLVALPGILLPDYAIFLIIVPVILLSAYTVAYSYVEYAKERKEGSKGKK